MMQKKRSYAPDGNTKSAQQPSGKFETACEYCGYINCGIKHAEITSKSSSAPNAASDTKASTIYSEYHAGTTGKSANPLLTHGITAVKKKKMPLHDTDVKATASVPVPPNQLYEEVEGSPLNESIDSIYSARGSLEGGDCPSSQEIPSSFENVSSIPEELNSSSSCSPLPRTLQRCDPEKQYLRALIRFLFRITQEWSRRDVFVYWGGTGTGKSSACRKHCAEAGLTLWVAPIGSRGIWFDGYDGHDAALFDDFDGEMPFRDLLNILEGNQVLVPVKGSFVNWRPRVVFFTCERPPNEWLFTFGKERRLLTRSELAQLERRITQVTHFATPYTNVLGVNPGGGNNDPPQDLFDVDSLINFN